MYRKISIALLLLVANISTAQAQLNNSQRGAWGGGAAGAVIGGIIGNQNDETPEGVLIGGAVGAIAGSLLGDQQDRMQFEQYQQRQRQAAYQQQQAQIQSQRFANGLSVGDVVALSQTGVSEIVITQQIQQYGIQQRIGVDEIISLHRQGVNNNVISAMQRAHFAGATPSVAMQPASSAIVGSYPNAIMRPVVTPPAIVVRPRPVVVSRPPIVIAPQPRVTVPRYAPPKYGYSRSAHGHRGGHGSGSYRR